MSVTEFLLSYTQIIFPIFLAIGSSLPFISPNSDRFALLPAQILFFIVAFANLICAIIAGLMEIQKSATIEILMLSIPVFSLMILMFIFFNLLIKSLLDEAILQIIKEDL